MSPTPALTTWRRKLAAPTGIVAALLVTSVGFHLARVQPTLVILAVAWALVFLATLLIFSETAPLLWKILGVTILFFLLFATFRFADHKPRERIDTSAEVGR